MSKTPRVSRRTVLRGMGAAMALPLLDAMAPAGRAMGAAAAKPPRRMMFVYVPNGAHMQDWTPKQEGGEYKLPPILAPLAEVKANFSVLTGLAHAKARANGDGAGDHARSVATFLTASQARKTAGADIHVGISVDQFAAEQIGKKTRFPSLEIGSERGPQSGNCDSGYSCAYSTNMAWRTPNNPVPKEIDPKQLFERLFGSSDKQQATAGRGKRERYNKSILDLVAEDARDLQRRLGKRDQQKLQQYLHSVREVESRIQGVVKLDAQGQPSIAKPSGIPRDYGQHVRILCDLVTLAFQADQTRIVTFMFANAGSNRTYPQIGVSNGHHTLSHHQGKREKQEMIAKINRYHIEQFAYLLGRLKQVRDGEGTLLDRSMIVYGSGIGDGNRHNHNDLPILLAGGGSGTLRPGNHVRYPTNTPLANLYLSLLDRMDVEVDRFGDGTGRLLDTV